MKAVKAVNSIAGNALTEEDLKRQRYNMERIGKLAAPTDEVRIEPFSVGDIACERVRPVMAFNPNHVILYAHGGGYTCGELGYARILAAKLAAACGFTVISFAYRLSPEYTYPAAIDDGYAVWEAMKKEACPPEKMLFAGDSAGGNLMLCLTQRLISEKKQPPMALLLFSPWTDMTATAASYAKYKDDDPILTYEYIVGVREAYTGIGQKDADTPDIDFSDPRYSPLYGDFSGFPPTLIQVGRNEVLFDDSDALAGRLRAAGSRAILDVEEDGWHVYQQMPIPMAHRAMQRLSEFVSDTVYK